MFGVMGNKGFHIKFSNGFVLSTQIGPGNYCDNYNMRIGSAKDKHRIESNEAEIAIWDADGEWCAKQMQAELFPETEYIDSVRGYVGIDDWLKILDWCRSQPANKED